MASSSSRNTSRSGLAAAIRARIGVPIPISTGRISSAPQMSYEVCTIATTKSAT
ncbi:hypothetical protein ACFQ0M_37880 [Kitasatospora aburaviensis]